MTSRAAFGVALGAYAMLLVVSAGLLPERVPMHFDASGDADRWAGRAEAVAFFGGTGLVLALLLGGSAAAAHRLPASMVNVPHQSWWVADPDRERRMRAMLRADLYWLAAATLAFLGVVVALTTRAARLDEPHLDAWFWVALGAFLALVLGYVVHSYRVRYRPEPEG